PQAEADPEPTASNEAAADETVTAAVETQAGYKAETAPLPDGGLTAGATAVIGEARLFAYRVNEDTLIGLINGTEGVSLKLGAEPAEIGGCQVAVTSIEAGVAALDVSC
ncbi:MAG: hypothetical protein AAGH74_13105, partial [Pseudomonadota bacterium]